ESVDILPSRAISNVNEFKQVPYLFHESEIIRNNICCQRIILKKAVGRKNAQKAQIKSLVTAYTVFSKPVYYLKITTSCFCAFCTFLWQLNCRI
ncbi:MAG: hypothetical protein WCL71_10035, partial [Deltaproteobacteria bacterium]